MLLKAQSHWSNIISFSSFNREGGWEFLSHFGYVQCGSSRLIWFIGLFIYFNSDIGLNGGLFKILFLPKRLLAHIINIKAYNF